MSDDGSTVQVSGDFDVTGAASFGSFSLGSLAIDGYKMLDMPSSSPERGPWNPIVSAVRGSGYAIYPDEDFHDGSNSVSVYNNQGGTGVVITRETDGTTLGQTAPNSSGYVLKIVNNGNATSPGRGGFVQSIPSGDNKTFVQIFQAKLPTGYSLVDAQNSQGSNATIYWLTNQAGTGKFEWYARVTQCGNAGTFSSGGHVYVNGGSSGAIFTWYLASCTLYEVTNGANFAKRQLTVGEYIRHDGDTDTNIRFQDNRLTLNSGGGAIVDAHSNGNLYFTGTGVFYDRIEVIDDTGITIKSDTNGAGANINFSDQTSNYSQTGGLGFFHADTASQGSGASFHFKSSETQVSVVAGDSDTSGKFISTSQGSVSEVDYGFADDLNTGMYRPGNHNLGLVTNGVERIRLTSKGHYGFQRAAKDGGTTWMQMFIGGQGNILSRFADASTGFMIANNYYVNSSNADKHLEDGHASRVYMADNNINMQVSAYNATAPSADATVTWKTAGRFTDNINTTQNPGLQMGASYLGFDESGTRSWYLNAAGGNLGINSGDTNGEVKTNTHFTSLGFVQTFEELYTRHTLKVLNAAGTGWHTWGTRGGGKYDLDVNNITCNIINASSRIIAPNTEKYYSLTGGDQDKFYPIVLSGSNHPSSTHEFLITNNSQSGNDPYNFNSVKGWARGQGWTDMVKAYEVTLDYYQSNERNILGVYRGTASTNDKIAIYVRGGETYWVTTKSTVNYYVGTGTSGGQTFGGTNDTNFGVKDSTSSDISGGIASTKLSRMVDLYNYEKGKYIDDAVRAHRYKDLTNDDYYLAPAQGSLTREPTDYAESNDVTIWRIGQEKIRLRKNSADAYGFAIHRSGDYSSFDVTFDMEPHASTHWGFCFGYQDVNNWHGVVFRDNNNVRVQKQIGGTQTNDIGETATGYDLDDGSIYKVRIVYVSQNSTNGRIVVIVNGKPIINSGFTAHHGSGQIGFAQYDNGDHTDFSNLQINQVPNDDAGAIMYDIADKMKIQTKYGSVDIGNGNSSYTHMSSSANSFYFNKMLTVDSGIVQSYNEDLVLRRANNNNHKITISETAITMTKNLQMGNLGIYGVNLLQINDPGPTEGIDWAGGNGWRIVECPDNMTTNSGGNLQFSTNGTRRVTMTTGGTLNATGDVIAYSDERVKDNIETIENALDKVSNLRGVSYNRNDVEDKSKKIGVIAQEVEKVLPEVVQYSESADVYSVAYGNMAGLFIEAIKELKAEVADLKAEIQTLKSK
jgi:hypothetical protein